MIDGQCEEDARRILWSRKVVMPGMDEWRAVVYIYVNNYKD